MPEKEEVSSTQSSLAVHLHKIDLKHPSLVPVTRSGESKDLVAMDGGKTKKGRSFEFTRDAIVRFCFADGPMQSHSSTSRPQTMMNDEIDVLE